MKPEKFSSIAGVLLLLMIFVSCGPRVSTQKFTEKPMNVYDTFAYLPNTNAEVPGMNYNDEDVNRDIIQAINRNLDNWYELDRQNPDILVLVSTATDVEVGVESDPLYATYPYDSPLDVSPFYDPFFYDSYADWPGIVDYNPDLYAYKEGTLVINLVDRETREIVWRGVAEGNIYNVRNRDALQGMVDNIFSEFPLNEE